MNKDIEAYVLSCPECQRRKAINFSMEPSMKNISVDYPFALIGMDTQELPLAYREISTFY